MNDELQAIVSKMGPKATKNMRMLLAGYFKGIQGQVTPEANKYYLFVYKAKTPNIQYDQYPLIICGNVFNWGFTGLNAHWGSIRQYSFGEVRSNLYELSDDEYRILEKAPLALFKNS